MKKPNAPKTKRKRQQERREKKRNQSKSVIIMHQLVENPCTPIPGDDTGKECGTSRGLG
jgi:hypothetical protein